MKKIWILISLIFLSISNRAQETLPNQFRDYVDHQMKWEGNKTEKNDINLIVIIPKKRFNLFRKKYNYNPRNFRCKICERNYKHKNFPPSSNGDFDRGWKFH